MQTLIEQAKKVIDKYYSPNHKVAALLRAKDGKLYEGVSVQGQKLHLCSEWSALTQALMDKADIEMIVAMRKKDDGSYCIYPPCGLCRELYLTYFPEAQVIVSENKIVKAFDLLPEAWTK